MSNDRVWFPDNKQEAVIIGGRWIMAEMSELHYRFKAVTGKSPTGWAMSVQAYDLINDYASNYLNKYKIDKGTGGVMMTHFEGVKIYIRPQGEPVEMLMDYDEAKNFYGIEVSRRRMI